MTAIRIAAVMVLDAKTWLMALSASVLLVSLAHSVTRTLTIVPQTLVTTAERVKIW